MKKNSMEYDCRTKSFSKIELDANGAVFGLCDACATKDCSHPIEDKQVSVFGIMNVKRMFMRGDEAHVVISCEGFLPIENKDESEEAKDS